MATGTKKEKKEKKFNSERTARLVKSSLKAAFPKDNFIVNSLVDCVEIMYFDTTVCSAADLNTFSALFCSMGNVKKEQLRFSKIKRETTTPAAPAPAASK